MDEVGITGETVEEFEQRITVATSNQHRSSTSSRVPVKAQEAQQIADSVAKQLLAIAATVGTDDEAVRSFVEEDMAAIQTQITQIRAEIATAGRGYHADGGAAGATRDARGPLWSTSVARMPICS